MSELNGPLTLDQLIETLPTLKLPPEREAAMMAEIYFSFGEYEKGNEAVQVYFDNAAAGLKRTEAEVRELQARINGVKDSEEKNKLLEELNVIVHFLSSGPCNICPRQGSPVNNGTWVYSSLKHAFECKC